MRKEVRRFFKDIVLNYRRGGLLQKITHGDLKIARVSCPQKISKRRQSGVLAQFKEPPSWERSTGGRGYDKWATNVWSSPLHLFFVHNLSECSLM